MDIFVSEYPRRIVLPDPDPDPREKGGYVRHQNNEIAKLRRIERYILALSLTREQEHVKNINEYTTAFAYNSITIQGC